MTTDQTNAREYVSTAMRGTLDDLRVLQRAADGAEDLSWGEIHALQGLGADGDDLRMEAEERMYEWPLAVETRRVFEIVLGTGGPDTRLEVECDCVGGELDGIAPAYEIRRIIYRYTWDGSGERVLFGEDFDIAERFARLIVPELVE